MSSPRLWIISLLMSAKKSEPKKPNGRPSEYKPEYCGQLIEHMRGGGSIEAFAGVVGKAKQTIYNWCEEHPEFLDARKEGEGLLNQFYEGLGKTMAAGQLRAVKSERPILDKKGKPVIDPATGRPMMEREYEHVTGSAAAWIFLTKNLLGWRDKREISGPDGGSIPVNFSNLSDAELQAKIDELVSKAKKK